MRERKKKKGDRQTVRSTVHILCVKSYLCEVIKTKNNVALLSGKIVIVLHMFKCSLMHFCVCMCTVCCLWRCVSESVFSAPLSECVGVKRCLSLM